MMKYDNHLVSKYISIIDALKHINNIKSEPLVLFVLDNNNRMVGTLTDGDVRRALISGCKLEDKIENVMHRNFNFICQNDNDIVQNLHHQRELMMKLVPILDLENHIVEIFNLEEFRTKLPIDAVLMAGGKGERLRPLTEKTPKPLLLVGDKCIIDHNIDRLISFGIENISVTVNYLKEQFVEHFSEPQCGLFVNIVPEPKFLGTMGSIQFVENFYNDTILVMNSDIFTDIDYEDFYLHFKQNNADMSVAAVPYTISVPYGIFELDGRNVKGVLEKPTYNYYANAGIYLIKRELLDLIPEGEFFNATDFMEMLMKNGYKVIRFPLNGTWIDIGNPQEYQKAKELVKHIK